MTIAIGINLGLYAILAADTRTTGYLFGVPHHYDDDSSKVQKTTMGLITGAGFLPLLERVKQELAAEEITNTERVLSIIKEQSERILQVWGTHPQTNSWIRQTGWIFSYTTLLDNQPTLRVGIFHPSIDAEMYATYEVGKPAIIFPVELDPETVDRMHDVVLREVKMPNQLSELESSVQHNSAVIAQVVRVLQPHCPSISRRFQVGVHRFDGQTGLSGLADIQSDGTFSLSIKLESS
jgi:hypothetical protein